MWRVGHALAGLVPHFVVAQCLLPLGKVGHRGVDAAVGLGGKEGFLAVVKLAVVALIAVGRVAVCHVGYHSAVFKVAGAFHASLVEDVLFHVLFKALARDALHNLVHQLEGGVDVLILATAWLEVEVVERLHVAAAFHIGGSEHKVAVAALACIGDARCVAQNVVQRDAVEEVGLELGEELAQRVAQFHQPFLDQLQDGHRRELFRHTGYAESGLGSHGFHCGHVGNAVALLKHFFAFFQDEHGGTGLVGFKHR